MLNDIRFRFASSTRPLNYPDILVWKRWLKPPANNLYWFRFGRTEIIQHDSFYNWLSPALAAECEFFLNRVTILESKVFEKFLFPRSTKPLQFVLISPKSYRLFFNLPQIEVMEILLLRHEKQPPVFSIFNSDTHVVPPETIKIELREKSCENRVYDTAIQVFITDKNLLPVNFNNTVLDIYNSKLFQDISISNDLLPSGHDTVFLTEKWTSKFFFGETLVSRELAGISPEPGKQLSLDETAFASSSFKQKYLSFLKHFTFKSEFGIYEYPLQKVNLKDHINLLKPVSEGFRIKNNGFQGFPVNSLAEVSISKNLLEAEIEVSLPFGTNFICENMMKVFPEAEIITENPETFPALDAPPKFGAEDNDNHSNGLFGFQDRGVNQLINNSFTLLSDESGLGMPVQASIALQHLAQKRKINSVLIICNRFGAGKEHSYSAEGSAESWLGHLNTWAPELISIALSPEDEKRIIEWKTPANVYVVYYDNLLQDDAAEIIDYDQMNRFDCIILDNYHSFGKIQYQKERVFQKLKLRYFWILDNSPTEEFDNNTISTFISTISFFTSLTPDTPAGNEYETLGEFTKRMPLKDLRNAARKNEYLQRISRNKWFKLNEEQHKDYNAAIEQGRLKLYGSVEKGNLLVIRPQIFSILHELLQILNLPASGNMSDKAIVLLEEVSKICGHGQKAVIFSQYEKYGLKKIEELFTEHKIKFVTYRAGMNNAALESACQSFRTNKDIHIFLADIKAVNKSLNLGDFNQIIHFDQWWNPVSLWLAEEKVCSSNNNHVLVQHFRTENTIEENIYDKLLAKGLLNKLIVESLSLSVVADMVSTKEWFDFFELDFENEALSDEPAADLKSVISSIKECSFLNFQSMINSFLTKTGFIKINPLNPGPSNNIGSLEAVKVINGKEENILIRLYHNQNVQDEDVIEFLESISGQSNYSKGLLITNCEFSYGSSKYGAVKINLLTLVDAKHLANYLVNFRVI